MMRSTVVATAAMLMTAMIGCEGGQTGPAHPRVDGGLPVSSDGWRTSGDQYVPAPMQDTGVLPPADAGPVSGCPEVDGDWVGTISGNTTGFFNFAVAGTMTMSLSSKGQSGDYVITAGEMVSAAKGLELFPFKYKVTGEVKCGVLFASNTVDIFGVQSTGKVTCTFDANGCQGSWDGQTTDGQTKGAGTFEVHRK